MAKVARKAQKKIANQNVVAQADIKAVYDAQAAVVALKEKLKAAEKFLAPLESGLLAKLEGGAGVEEGNFVAALERAPGRIAVPWKAEAIKAIVKAEGCTELQAEANVKARFPAQMQTNLIISNLEA
jgi:hypothetical protein